MSIQAVAWALEQDFSYTTPQGREMSAHVAKLVLISLANHADHTSGHCWPSAKTIAREASCKERSVYRIVAALERNNFIDIKRSRGPDGKQRSNNYWIRFDRKPAPWQFFPDDDDDGGAAPDDTESPGETVENPPENDSKKATESVGPSDIRVTPHNMLEPSVLEPSVPSGFAPSARADEQARLHAAELARRGDLVFVILGTEAWTAWERFKGRPLPTTTRKTDGKRGWFLPSLFPPKATGPPPVSNLMRPGEENDFIN